MARHDGRNLAMAALSALTVRLAEAPVVEPLAHRAAARRLGLVQRLALPLWARRALMLLLLDHTLYLWHVLTHRVPALWRLHLVHHTDLDLSATTALRFHAAEILASVPWRAAQVRLIGVDPWALRLWQRLTLAEILFHHSNLRLPRALERRLEWLIVTPRLHGIHHSVVRAETESNWSSGLTLWDWLHGTLTREMPQEAETIGVPAYRDARALRLASLIAMPFGPERDAWSDPGPPSPADPACALAR
jgi:sterol desaturase/sphingolipid hydroxylase (fatty acid hydroxylase superfamily)